MHGLNVAGTRVVVEPGAIDRLEMHVAERLTPHRVAIVTDTNVGPLYAERAAAGLARFFPVVVTMPAGEANKTRETWATVTDDLIAKGLGRDTVIIALGGGVVGDLAGFVASSYLRGVPVVQVPSSLVAMIDASIGGKTGVDTPAGKNLVGAFHLPALVVVDPDLLGTLPERELRGGMAEALKHGVIADAAYFETVANQRGTPPFEMVLRSIAIKGEIVNDDPLESGRRKVLNFGHTLGHAIESASDYTLSHGEAIAIGMVLEAKLGERLGVTAHGTAERIDRALKGLGLPTTTHFDPADLVARTQGDKKKRAGAVEYALPREVGRFEDWAVRVEDREVLAVLRGDDPQATKRDATWRKSDTGERKSVTGE